MDISTEAQEALQIAASSSKISDEHFKKLVKYVVSRLLQEVNQKQDENFSSAHTKLACFGLATLFLEASKHNTNVTIIRTHLEGLEFASERITEIVNAYEAVKCRLQAQLSSIGSYLPHIVDAEWRQDYIIRSIHMDKICNLDYKISLKTEVSGSPELETLQFSCSLEQLQDLVSKLKDAAKAVERISQAT